MGLVAEVVHPTGGWGCNHTVVLDEIGHPSSGAWSSGATVVVVVLEWCCQSQQTPVAQVCPRVPR